MSAQPSVPATSVAAVLDQIPGRLGAAQTSQAQTFTSHLLRRVAVEDVAARSAQTWAALSLGMLEFLRVRRVGVPAVRVFNPNLQDHGWDSAHTVVEIVTDDAPFLVDSVGIAVSQVGLLLYAVIHPVFTVERDPGGHMLSLSADGAGKGKPESVMHIEVDRISEPAAIERLEQSVRAALQDVANCVEDWGAMREKLLSIANELGHKKLPVSA